MPWRDVHHSQASYKDSKRVDTYVKILQSRVDWREPIVLPLSPYLAIVKSAPGTYVVKCLCGRQFGDYRRNWQLSALTTPVWVAGFGVMSFEQAPPRRSL